MLLAGGFVYYSFASARQDDEEEAVRIKEETEKMERMSKEFTDIDEGVTVDEDLMKSLRSRMKNQTDDGEGGDAPDGGDGPSMGGGDGNGGAPGSDGGGGTAVLEPPEAGSADEPPSTSKDDIARLNRLMGLPDAEK